MMKLKQNISILIFVGLLATTYASLPLTRIFDFGILQPVTSETAGTTVSAQSSSNLFLRIFRLLWNRRFNRPVEQVIVKDIDPEPVVLQRAVPFYVPQPYPVTQTIVKEIPILQTLKEYFPVNVPVHKAVPLPYQTIIQHHENQPTVTKVIKPQITKVVTPTITNVIENPPSESLPTIPLSSSPSIEPVASISSPSPIVSTEIEEEIKDENEIISEVELTLKPIISEDNNSPSASPHQPFNEYGLPEEGSKQQSFRENLDFRTDTDTDDDNIEIPISGTYDEGKYSNSYILSDGTRVAEEGKLVKGKAGNDVLVKKGNYEFKDTDGKLIKVNWVADEMGFRIIDP